MHAYFLRAGDPNEPIEFEVDPIRNGRSFATRRVVALQHQQAIFNTSISYQIIEQGLEHCAAMPDVVLEPFDGTQPVRPNGEIRFPLLARYGVERMRGKSHQNAADTVSQSNWYRVVGSLRDEQRQHQAGLALISDFSLLSTTVIPHNSTDFQKEYMFASLDHAIWFHAPINLNEIILYHCDSPWSGNARGFNRGQFWSQNGTLLASTTQEGLMRKRSR
jgi:acyl-CoA thioesterase-2